MSTWMVVEDEPDIYEVLLAMFEMWGIEGVAFTDGEEAVSWIDDVDRGVIAGELPELALLDIRLPGSIDGPKVGERLRRSSQLRNIAVVLTTAYHLSPDEERQAMTQAGADRLIYKPLPKFNELKQLLEALIAERRARNATDAPTSTSSSTPSETTPPLPTSPDASPTSSKKASNARSTASGSKPSASTAKPSSNVSTNASSAKPSTKSNGGKDASPKNSKPADEKPDEKS